MLNNVKEKTCKFLERNRYAITYGIYCGGCVVAGYMLGKHVTAKRIEAGFNNLMIANPKIIEELAKADETLIGIGASLKSL